MDEEFIKDAIFNIKEQSEHCNSINEYLDLAYSFNFRDLTINPFQIKNEIATLLKILKFKKPKIVLEIGTAKGGSLFLFSKVCPPDTTLIGIDLPEGHFGGEFFSDWKTSFYKSFATQQQKIHIIRADSHNSETLDEIKVLLNGKKIDFLFIDGDHRYESVKKDFELYGEFLSDDGIIAFHDISLDLEENVGEVPKFWKEIKSKHESLEILDTNTLGYGIGLLFPNGTKIQSLEYSRILKTVLENQLTDREIKKRIQEPLGIKEIQYNEFQKEFDERSEWALELDEKVVRLQKMNAHLRQAQFELIAIKNSLIFKQMRKITKFIDTILPLDSGRRRIFSLQVESIKLINNDGWKAFFSVVREKFRSISFFTRIKYKIKKPVISENYFKTTTIELPKDIQIITSNEEFTPDPKLRSFLKPTSHEIYELPLRPLVSIIIPTYNAVELLKLNLEVIRDITLYPNYEIIIVTNNLDENSEMRKFLSTLKHKVLIFKNDYSFSAVNNLAASKSKGDFLLFLNDDVRVMNEGWLHALVKLGLQKNVGAVGAKLLFPNMKIQEAGCIIWKNGFAWNYGRNKNANLPQYNFVREVDYCSASCLLVKKKVFDEVGGFDTSYKIAYGEDSDLCMSMKKSGYKVMFQPLSEVIHYEGSTAGTDVNKGIKSNQIKNQQVFYNKWKSELSNHRQDSDENSYLESNRKPGLNILYIDHYVPEYDKDAGSVTTFNFISSLLFMGHKVTFWPQNGNQSQPYTRELQQKGAEVIYDNYDLKNFIKKRKHVFSICFIARPTVGRQYLDLIKKHMPNCKIVYEASDLHYLRLFREAKINNDNFKMQQAIESKKLEFDLIQKSDISIFRTIDECKIAISQIPSIKTAAATSYFFEINPKKYEERKNLAFLGGYSHPPNEDAVLYFIQDIFPLIQEKLSNVKFFVVGSNPSKTLISLCEKTKNCELIGYVPDASEFLNNVKLMVAPLRFGAGIKGKIIHSLCCGLPTITTKIGVEGMPTKDNPLIICENPQEFASKVIEIYDNEDVWNDYSMKSITFANHHFSPEKTKQIFSKIFDKIL